MADRRTFADAFNYLLYDGRQTIDPDALRPLDTTITGIPFGADGVDTPVQRFRDELKYLTLMEDGSAVYLLLGIENQSDVNYAMPVKDMVYDALQYAAQVEKTARTHRERQKAAGQTAHQTTTEETGAAGQTARQMTIKETGVNRQSAHQTTAEETETAGQTIRQMTIEETGVNRQSARRATAEETGAAGQSVFQTLTGDAKKNRVSSGEYLTGFYKSDRLVPVITLVVFFSAEPWDGPRSIHDMFSVDDPRILSFVPDYRINLIAPGEMSDEELGKFATNLREVLLFIKHSKDKDRLHALVSENHRFRSVEGTAAKVIRTITGSELKFSDEGEEESDMCKALEDMRNDALAEGRTLGIAEGRTLGRAEGRAEGKAEGRTLGKAESILELLTYLPGMISESLRASILGERDSDTLSNYLRLAATSSSVEEFSSQLS